MIIHEKTSGAFTLIELLVVVAVLALLASIVFSNLGGAREGARISNALSFQSQAHNLLGSDLVGWWNFDEGSGTTAKDISGYENHGTIVGAKYVDGVPGTGGTALDLGEGGNYVDVGNSSVFNFQDEFTLSVWIKADSIDEVVGGVITKGQEGGWINNEYMLLRSSGDSMRFYVSDGTSSNNINIARIDLATGNWIHVIGTISRITGEMKAYLNGEIYNQIAVTIDEINSTTKNLRIGQGHSSSGGTWFGGLIDDVRIYSRALTAFEVQTLYAQTKGKYLSEKND